MRIMNKKGMEFEMLLKVVLWIILFGVVLFTAFAILKRFGIFS